MTVISEHPRSRQWSGTVNMRYKYDPHVVSDSEQCCVILFVARWRQENLLSAHQATSVAQSVLPPAEVQPAADAWPRSRHSCQASPNPAAGDFTGARPTRAATTGNLAPG